MKPTHEQQGFSLVEMLVASTIFFTFMVSMMTIYSHGHRSYVRGQNRIEVHQSARVAMTGMMRELRLAGYDPSGAIPQLANPCAVQEALPDSITFVGDTNGDAVTDRVVYRIEQGELIREFSSWDGNAFPAGESGELAEGVESLALAYFDGVTPPSEVVAPVDSPDLPAIRRVNIGLTTRFESIGQQEQFPLAVDVFLRNTPEPS